jgi:hypothetical protein
MTGQENEAASPVTARLWWAVPAAAFLVLIGLALVFGKEPEQKGHGTSYDASGKGFRAAYLLLEELGYPVVRGKRLGGRDVRWVLFPTTAQQEAAQLDAWVRQGGLVLLADDSKEFAAAMGITLSVEHKDQDPGEETASALGVTRLAGGQTLVDWSGQPGIALIEAGDKPVVTVYARGRGEVWLVNRPEFLSNRLLPRADNAVLLCRLATETLQHGPDRLAFDEYFHGMRDRPGIMELLFQPPAIWVTVHGFLLLGLLLWHYVPRFGVIHPLPAPTRRSRKEFLEAMAYLLERKGNYSAAFAVVRDAFAQELEQQLGLPLGRPAEEVVAAARRRRPMDNQRLLRLLQGEVLPAAADSQDFLKALNEVETARDEFCNG